MLRAYINHIVIGSKHLCLHALNRAIWHFYKSVRIILILFIIHANGVKIRIGIVILTKRVTHPVIAKEETAHIGMTDKFNAVEIIHLAFLEISDFPQVAHGVNHRLLPIGNSDLHSEHLPIAGSGSEVIDYTE